MTDDPSRELRVLTWAVRNARIGAIEDEYKRELARMDGDYRADYEQAERILADLTERGWFLVMPATDTEAQP